MCPGTGTNMNSARSKKIFQNANKSLARKLPKYDFPDLMVNVTPGTHRVLSKEVININGKEEIKLTNDTTFVFARSKHFVGSSGTVWASEFMCIRNEEPQLFESEEPKKYQSTRFRALMYGLKDNMLLFLDATDVKDLKNVSRDSLCKFRNYEQSRSKSLQRCVEETVDYYGSQKETFNFQESKHFEEIVPALRNLIVAIDTCIERLGKKAKGSELLDTFKKLVGLCTGIAGLIDSMNFPLPKTQFIEWTDAGPGVSVSNHDVRLRIAQRIRILNMDYYIRHHLAQSDSSQNEVERAQSYIADALCDGGSLQWEYRKMFERLSMEDIEELSSNDVEELELKRMKFNAFKVCEEVSQRLDGTTGPGGYLKSLVTDSLDKLFFFDKEYADEYLSKPKNATVPGCNYYQKLERFLENHCRKGEKFLKFVKFECQNRNGEVTCDFYEEKTGLALPQILFLHQCQTSQSCQSSITCM